MDTKLTLKLNQEVIEKAKFYAKSNHTSLSKLIENYLNSLTQKEQKSEIEVSPLVSSLTGVISDQSVNDFKKEYREYLEKKYR
ncbi:MAG: DUF6364 family protein [Flavobacteriaceae bacterium]